MKNKRGGFTLVEVMTVVLLFGLLLLLIFPMRRMLFRVLERAEEQEHAEMVGDDVFRYVTDGLQTGSIRREDIENISLDKFGENDLVPEISIEDAGDTGYSSGSMCPMANGFSMRGQEIFCIPVMPGRKFIRTEMP